MRLYIIGAAFFGCIHLCAAAQQGRSPLQKISWADPLIPRLIAQPFNDPLRSTRYFNSLSAPRTNPFAERIGWRAKTPAQLAELAAAFPLPQPLQDNSKIELRTFVGGGQDALYRSPHMILMGILARLDGDGKPTGSFSVLLKRGKNAELQSHIINVYFDRTDPRLSRIAPAILGFLKNEIYPVVGSPTEMLKANHAGRYVWAKQKFQFSPADRFTDVGGKGPAIGLPELARRNFSRFIQLHGVAVQNLSLRGRALSSLRDLRTPDDFASVVHRNNRTLTIRPFMLGARQPAIALPVGKAFMLADYRPQGGRFVTSLAGPKYSATAMPPWNGWRKP